MCESTSGVGKCVGFISPTPCTSCSRGKAAGVASTVIPDLLIRLYIACCTTCWAVQVSPSPLPLHRLVIGASYAHSSFTGLLHNFGFVRGPSFLHCFQAVGQTGAPGAVDDHREEWCAIFRKPGRWKRLLERAERWHIYRHQAEAHFQVFVRQVWEPFPTPVVFMHV